jgi:hypothetical protein
VLILEVISDELSADRLDMFAVEQLKVVLFNVRIVAVGETLSVEIVAVLIFAAVLT